MSARIDYIVVERGVEFDLHSDAQVIKIEPVQGTMTYRVWYVINPV